jgi:hypothetical protein
LNADVAGAAGALVTAGPRDTADTALSQFDYAEEPSGTPERLALFAQASNVNINTPAKKGPRNRGEGSQNAQHRLGE